MSAIWCNVSWSLFRMIAVVRISCKNNGIIIIIKNNNLKTFLFISNYKISVNVWYMKA